MQLSDIRPGARLLWRHRTPWGDEIYHAARVVRLTARRVVVLVMTPRGAARRCLQPERLFKKGHRP